MYPPQVHQEQNPKAPAGAVWMVSMIMIAVFLWAIAGIAAFIMSIVCFGRSGTTGQHVIGLALAVLFGPVYWIYYYVAKGYCKSPGFVAALGGRRR